jgi:hypothetical protein
MKTIKEHLQQEADQQKRKANHAEENGRAYAKEAAESFASAEVHRKQAAEFQRLADAQPE